MGRPVPSYSPKETRVRKLGEVSLGFNKKITQDEARRCPQCAVATCLPGCPLGIDIPGFIRLLREGDNAAALERIKKENPFPAICGRLCPAPCEDACVFHADGQPIAIRELERFAADFGTGKPEKIVPPSHAKKIAVIGSGPAGMSAAYYLARGGLNVTIFEAAHEPGGMLRWGIPEFRLPQKVLDEQFAQLRLLGVQIQTDVVFGRTMMMDEFFMRGFSALLLATGTALPRFSDLRGSQYGGVYYDVEFLSRLQTIHKESAIIQADRQQMPAGKTVVLGSGPAAFDAARLSVRLGNQVTMVFEGFEEEAGVSHAILNEAREEGIEIHPMQALEIMADEQGFVQGVQCRKLDIVEDGQGLRLAPSAEAPTLLEAQTVIIANGQQDNGFLKQYLPQLKWEANGRLWTNEQTGMTSIEKLFACQGGSIVEAMAAGKKTAQQIIQYLGNL